MKTFYKNLISIYLPTLFAVMLTCVAMEEIIIFNQAFSPTIHMDMENVVKKAVVYIKEGDNAYPEEYLVHNFRIGFVDSFNDPREPLQKQFKLYRLIKTNNYNVRDPLLYQKDYKNLWLSLCTISQLNEILKAIRNKNAYFELVHETYVLDHITKQWQKTTIS